jgi:hypothetical protein
MNVFVLICVFLTSNGVQFVDQPFTSMKECQAAASAVTERLVSSSINQGTVTCTAVTLGSFA